MELKEDKQESSALNKNSPHPLATEKDRQAVDVLLQVSHMVGGNLELNKVLAASMHAAAVAMEAEACSVLLQEEHGDKKELYFFVTEGSRAGGLKSIHMPVDDHSIAGWVANHGKPLLLPDAYQDSRFDPQYDRKTGFHTKSIICAPLQAKGRQLGVIEILNRRDGESFNEMDLELLEAVAGMIAVAIDTAEEHQARMEAERLATIGRAMAGMAHCIKNVLNGLQAGSYILDQTISKDTSDKNSSMAHGWNILKRNMQFLNNIVLDMLSYSKKRKPLYQPCCINDLCKDVTDLLQQQASEKNVKLTDKLSTKLKEAWIDDAGIRRCLLNLVGNAIDACEKGRGVVCIETITVNKDNHFVIHISDNGCGMEKESREKIFDPFFSTKGSKGTGLGLAVTKKIIEEHGGTIKIESTPGHGTDFLLELPVQRPTSTES